MEQSLSKDKIMAMFSDLEPKEEGVKGLTFIQDCHTKE